MSNTKNSTRHTIIATEIAGMMMTMVMVNEAYNLDFKNLTLTNTSEKKYEIDNCISHEFEENYDQVGM